MQSRFPGAAQRLEGEVPVLVLPAIPYGVTRYGSAFPGTLSIREETLAAVVTEIAESVAPVVLVNSHFEPEQVQMCDERRISLVAKPACEPEQLRLERGSRQQRARVRRKVGRHGALP